MSFDWSEYLTLAQELKPYRILCNDVQREGIKPSLSFRAYLLYILTRCLVWHPFSFNICGITIKIDRLELNHID